MYRLLKNIAEILFMVVIWMICDLTGTEKYIVILGLTLLCLIVGRKKQWPVDILLCISLPVVTYLIIGSVSSILSATVYVSTVKTVLFWMLPLLFAFSVYIVKDDGFIRVVDVEFIGCCIAYVIINARFLRYYMKVESMFSFAFGAFFLYYFHQRKWKFLIVAAYFLFVTDKRITLLAAMACMLILIILELFRNNRKLVYLIWGTVMTFVGIYLWFICSGRFEYYATGIGINTNGRTEMYSQLLEWISSRIMFVGKGLGVVETLLEAWNIRTFSNLHNDLLKFYIELGFIGLSLFFISYLVIFAVAERKFGEKKMCMLLALSIYSMMLFATDNVSIYILYLIPYYSIMLAVLISDQENEKRKNYDQKNNS